MFPQPTFSGDNTTLTARDWAPLNHSCHLLARERGKGERVCVRTKRDLSTLQSEKASAPISKTNSVSLNIIVDFLLGFFCKYYVHKRAWSSSPSRGRRHHPTKLYWTLQHFQTTQVPLSSFSKRLSQCYWKGWLQAKAAGQGLLILWFCLSILHWSISSAQVLQVLQGGRQASVTHLNSPTLLPNSWALWRTESRNKSLTFAIQKFRILDLWIWEPL